MRILFVGCHSAAQAASPVAQDRKLPKSAETWSVEVDNKELNYGQVHEMIHRDIAIGNDYRKERLKLLTALATGVFALTVTFHKDLFGETLTQLGLWLMLSGWVMLIVSLLAGILHFQKWEDFYLEHRVLGTALWRYWVATGDDKKHACDDFFRAEDKIKKLRKSYRKWNFIQSAGLLLGLAFIAVYVGVAGHQVVSSVKPDKPSALAPAPSLGTPAANKND
jgi:hypothetical protein